VVVFFTTPLVVSADDYQAEVISVLDGDMIEVLHNNHAERISLNGIDCPEKGQPYGAKAKQATSKLVFGKKVTLQTHGLDKDGRTLAEVSLSDGVIVNVELVRNGSCWWYQHYAPDNVILAELQRRARRSGLGLWADPNPVPPWEWRKRADRALTR
jgi:endonuclease YncB( thermonuclease family)